MQAHWKKQKFILGNPQGEENSLKLPLYRCVKITNIKPQTCASSPCIYISLSLLCTIHKWVCVCVQMRNTPPLFILFLPLDFFPNKSAPTNLLGRLHLGRHKTILYYIQEGSIDLTYNRGFTSWLYNDQIQQQHPVEGIKHLP